MQGLLWYQLFCSPAPLASHAAWSGDAACQGLLAAAPKPAPCGRGPLSTLSNVGFGAWSQVWPAPLGSFLEAARKHSLAELEAYAGTAVTPKGPSQVELTPMGAAT